MSLASTNGRSDAGANFSHSSDLSITKHETLSSTLEKLRQRFAIVQQRRTTALHEFDDQEKRLKQLNQAVVEADARCQKLQQKLQHYKEGLNGQISEGLAQQQEQLEQMKATCAGMKERYQELEDNRKRQMETGILAKNRVENSIQQQLNQRDQTKQIIMNLTQQSKEMQTQINVLQNQLGKILQMNKEKTSEYRQMALRYCSYGDEDYSRYILQITEAKQLTTNQDQFLNQLQQATNMNSSEFQKLQKQLQSNQKNGDLTSSQRDDTLTNLFANKCQYKNEWNVEIQKPRQEQNIQVNTPNKNMNASITIFDEDTGDNYTFTQNVQEKTPIIKRAAKSAKEQVILGQKQQGYGRSNVNFADDDSIYDGKAKITQNKQKSLDRGASTGYSKKQTSLERIQSISDADEHELKIKKKTSENPKKIKTQTRDDIIIGLESKIQDAVEQKIALNRRLEAIKKSYANTNDKTVRMNQIRTQITSKMIEIKMMKDRLARITKIK